MNGNQIDWIGIVAALISWGLVLAFCMVLAEVFRDGVDLDREEDD